VTSPASVEGGERLRLFLALRLPDDGVHALLEWAAWRLAGVKRLPAESLHVTLAFLGSRPAAELDAIVAALRAAAAAARPPALVAERYRETRSVGMLVLRDEGGRAGALAHDLHGRLERLGVYRPERRPWLPHVTLLRFRQGAAPRFAPPPPELPPILPSEAAAYLSRLHPAGARYEVLESVPLGG
jgi:RNA 2',3'-cyclic 3'-phosphodiesterase